MDNVLLEIHYTKASQPHQKNYFWQAKCRVIDLQQSRNQNHQVVSLIPYLYNVFLAGLLFTIETEILYHLGFPYRVFKRETVAIPYRAWTMVTVKCRNPPVLALSVTTHTNRTFIIAHCLSYNQNMILWLFAYSYNYFTGRFILILHLYFSFLVVYVSILFVHQAALHLHFLHPPSSVGYLSPTAAV
jgi:hypothetical protein